MFEAALVSDRSASGLTFTVAESMLSAGLKSGSAGNPPAASLEMVAVFVTLVPAAAEVTSAMNVAVTASPCARGPRWQVTTPAGAVQPFGDETNWSPGGSGSVMTAPVVPSPTGAPPLSPTEMSLVPVSV